MRPSSESVLRKRNAMTHSKKMKNARLCQLLVSFSSQCLYWKRRITIVIWARHTGQPASSSATSRAQLSQKRACPHGTNANPWRAWCTRHTSQDSSWAGGSDTDEFDADDVVVAVAVVTWVSSASSLLLLLSSVGRSASVCAPMECLTADRNCIRV